MTKPTIGITLDYVKEGGFSKRPHYALRQHYFDAISAAGGIPFAIAHDEKLIDDVLPLVDAIIIPGGDFAFDPSWYAAGEKSPFDASPRLNFDIEIIKKSLAAKLPLLGICAGMQILAGAHGCKLSGNIQKHSSINCNHLNEKPSEEYAHRIIVTPNSVLAKIVGAKEFEVNSRHTEGVIWPSDKILVSGVSDDGIIEAIEVKGAKFALGVQWHPEYFSGDANAAIFKALVKAATN